ncbi:MAG: class I SAM-dependent methyltransferase [Patescibacteria group bacterium]|nr:class I SAM-dependent methyltransferase [Patescibacteria group bacterium]
MQCPICDSKNIKNVILKEYTGYKCLNCEVEFVWPQPTKEELSKIYQDGYYKSWGVEGNKNDEVRLMKIATSKKYLKAVKKYKEKGKLLDIGCAFGYLLEAAEESGFDIYGVELSRFSSDFAQKKFVSKIFNGELKEAKFPENNFDVIVMSDLLEHIPKPVEFLIEVKRIIKKDGVIVIITPDTDSFSRKILRPDNWFHYKLEHLFYYNKKSLSNLLNKFDFSLLNKKPAVKAISLLYLKNQLNIFRNHIFTPVINFIFFLSPEFIKKKYLYISGGEMFAIFKKTHDCY